MSDWCGRGGITGRGLISLILLRCCTVLVVLDLEGWEKSVGVGAEIEASEVGSALIPVAHVKWCSNCNHPLFWHSPNTDCQGFPSILSSIRHLIAA